MLDYTDCTNETQEALEAASLSVGADRYIARQEDRAKREGMDRRDNVAAMIRGALPILAAAIRKWIDETTPGQGKKPFGLKPLQLLDADLVAYAGLSKTFFQLGKGGDLPNITIGIGRAIEIELEAVALADLDAKDAKKLSGLINKTATADGRERTHQRRAVQSGVDLNWTSQEKMRVGADVLGVILTSLSDIFERATVPGKPFPLPVVRLTDEAATELATMEEATAWLRPTFQPMLTAPRPWVSFDTGCYNDDRLRRAVPLVRTFSKEHKGLLRDAISSGAMQPVLAAVNAIQGTRFAIDERVLQVVTWVREAGLRPSTSFPASELPPVPEKATDEAWAAMASDERTARSRQRKAIRDLRAAAGIEGAVFASDTDMAAFLADEGGFYLPHSLDFRGRVYAVPHFNHQRSDHMKAMFRFADAVPLGDTGGDWLMIHLANCGDFGKVSKKPFTDRIAWCRENERDILLTALDPQGHFDWWSEADSPFCFLQACFEYHAWWATGFSTEYASSISGAADGSCSGLQHYAAMMRAEKEAVHVNLVPRDTVGDIYLVTADAAVLTLTAVASHGDIPAQTILAVGFGRSNVKRNVMTYFYGSGKFGMRDQHMEDTMRPLADAVAMGSAAKHLYELEVKKVDDETGEETTRLDGGFSCAQVMAAHVHAAVVSVAPKADEAASWIQAVAAVLAHESQSMIWTTPLGMPVVQRYSEYTSKQINLWLHDRKVLVPTGTDKLDGEGSVLSRVRLLIREAPTKRVNKKRMRSASAPNVVHSMDGCHLQLAVLRGHQAGIQHFSMIHDSFGTHLGNMDRFVRIVRSALVELYETYCPLQAIVDHARTVLSEEGIERLPAMPSKGSLDLNLVLQAEYAFA